MTPACPHHFKGWFESVYNLSLISWIYLYGFKKVSNNVLWKSLAGLYSKEHREVRGGLCSKIVVYGKQYSGN